MGTTDLSQRWPQKHAGGCAHDGTTNDSLCQSLLLLVASPPHMQSQNLLSMWRKQIQYLFRHCNAMQSFLLWRFSWPLPFNKNIDRHSAGKFHVVKSYFQFSSACFILKLSNLKWKELLVLSYLEFDGIFFLFKEREMLLHTIIYSSTVSEIGRCWFHFACSKMFKLLTQK